MSETTALAVTAARIETVIGWFIVPYVRRTSTVFPERYCAMNDHNALIAADGGSWTETEILGNRSLVKVKAGADTLLALAQVSGFRRLPLPRLVDSMGTLTQAQRDAVRTEILDCGYTATELDSAIPDMSVASLNQVLGFMASRRLKPRYDSNLDEIICDGAAQPVRPISNVDSEIT